jgi:HTH-type transcriptional regulator/antitoxin HigA
MELIRQFPLRPIRSDAECERATSVLDRLITADDPDSDTADYLEILAGLVESYDQRHHPVESAKLTTVQRLKFLMQENEMTTADLGRLLGNSGLASMILHGRRSISKTNAKILAKRFGLDAGVFI